MEIKVAFLWRQNSSNQACVGFYANASNVSCCDPGQGVQNYRKFVLELPVEIINRRLEIPLDTMVSLVLPG